jgi:hypothetical protein
MRPFYSHTQRGALTLLAIIPAAVGMAVGAYFTGRWLAFAPLAVVVVGIVAVFSSLTVEVATDELSWHFGPGVWRKTIARAEIVSAVVVTNKWWWGWGVHLTPRGWLYNVEGLEAVEIALKDGKTLRIGSDEAANLARALSRA